MIYYSEIGWHKKLEFKNKQYGKKWKGIWKYEIEMGYKNEFTLSEFIGYFYYFSAI